MFFDDSEAFDVLAAEVLPRLIQRASGDAPLRLWVPACSSGADAYSLGICLLELFEAARREPRLQIFATDRNEVSLAVARRGVYPHTEVNSLATDRLAGFFERLDAEHYRVSDRLRQTVTFGPHDVLADPAPFSRLDLISFRHFQGELAPRLRTKLISRFHFALNPGGHLLLGPSAIAPGASNLFSHVSKEWSIYRRSDWPPVDTPEREHGPSSSQRLAQPDARARKPASESEPVAGSSADRSSHEGALQTANSRIAWLTEELRIADDKVIGSDAALRSLNEELSTFSEELHHKVGALNAANDILTNLISAIDLAMVFLDSTLHLRRYTPSAARLLRLAVADLGKPVSSSALNTFDNRLLTDIRDVIATGTPIAREIRTREQRWYLQRVLPYLVGERPLGVVVTWFDVTQLKALQEEVVRTAAREQRRVGQELHDGILQELTGLGLLAETLAEQVAGMGGERASEIAGRLARGIAETNRHARSVARGLVPVPVDADSLVPALAELARTTEETYRTSCRFELLGPVSVAEASVATHLYRIAQEALRNAQSHSKADSICVRLGQSDAELVLEISDNGVGIPQPPRARRGVGLRLMEHRCSLIGAHFAVTAQEGGGTLVSCRMPVTIGVEPPFASEEGNPRAGRYALPEVHDG